MDNGDFNNKDFKSDENRENGWASLSKNGYNKDVEAKNKKPKRKKGLFSYFIVALIAALLGGIMSVYIAPNFIYGKLIPVPSIYQNNADNHPNIEINTKDDLSTITAVAKKNMKSVVGITTIETENNYFFGPTQRQGVGSGVIIDSKGYILTNSHVIGNGNAEEITVQFEDGSKKEGKVLWYETGLDLAVVKVNANNLPKVELGDSDKLEVGELAVAIGNPLGLQYQRTVTSGIVSGLDRTINDGNIYMEDLIQTDASINPGNSGGPLLNSKGEVIGINTAKITSAEGLGFSIPINTAKSVISQVINKGEVKPVYMGIKGIKISKYEKALGIKLSIDEGIILVEIVNDSPAYNAGLRPQDIITKVDGNNIIDMNSLRKILYNYEPGDKANLTVIRNGEEMNLKIIFGETPNNW
ncbi:MAG: trypsin-like serine protease [Firmicutes bacterium]|nr:trypsin-like serine protease [Bacillota bacterium]